MCGIAGIWTPATAVDRSTLEAMVGAMRHRGPDGEGMWVGESVGLGMRRLAIVDVLHGSQPLTNEDSSIRVVFNGEIYNHAELRAWLTPRGHQLRSDTDGEVISHLYEELGPEFVKRLDGIFAIALWDAPRRRLTLARDQLGVKPLYLHQDGVEVRFASELKSLLSDPAVPRRLDLTALDHHLAFRFTPAPRTLLAGVEKLPPAGLVVVDEDGSRRDSCYWQPQPAQRRDLSFAGAADEFRHRLEAAVKRQMMSDRPIGAMLSGGIDSAAVVALMARHSNHVRTYTVGFEGGGDADETALARQTAALFATDHEEVVLPLAYFRDHLAGTVEMLEEPVATSSAIGFREVSRLASATVPVLLSGQGADELLAGYWRYVGEWLALRSQRAVGSLGLSGAAGRLARRTSSARLERGLRALRHPQPLDRFMSTYAVFDDAAKAELYKPELARALIAAQPAWTSVEALRRRAAGRDPLAQMMYVDTRLWLPDDLLLVGDKMSMAESVEMRVPYLDRELVEFVESLPTSFKLRRGVRKAVHKRAMTGLLPRAIVHRKERGFSTPVGAWFRQELHEEVRGMLLAPDGVSATLFERQYLERLLQRHREATADHTRQLFCLFSLELWGRRFLGQPPSVQDTPRQPVGESA